MKDYSKHKKIMRAIGIPLLIIGIILLMYGFISFSNEGIDQASKNQMIFLGGGILAMIGFSLVGISLVRPVSKYYATEASPAITTASHALGKGLAQGLKESREKETSQIKEIVKVKCKNCGYLDSEDAEFCSKCGKKI